MEQAAGSLVSLRFSRGDESEADARSGDYLCDSRFAANGAAGFFERTRDAATPPEFLSTHPNPKNRVQDINERPNTQRYNLAEPQGTAFREFQHLMGG